MRTLVTGISGFLGGHLLNELLREDGPDTIVALSSSTPEGIETIPSAEYKFGKDYLVENGCADVTTLLHMGAFTPKDSSQANDIERSTSNVVNTAALLRACSSLPQLRRIVFTSTIDVYGDVCGKIKETTSAAPRTLYGWSKLYCEHMISSYCLQKGISCAILRVGHVYGEGEEAYRKVIPVMIGQSLRKERIRIYGDGLASRSFIYVRDVARAIVAALHSEDDFLVNLTGSQAITMNELAEMIIKMVGANKIPIEHVETDIPNVSYTFDCSLMRKLDLCGETPFREGLEKEIAYMEGQDAE